MFYFFKKIYIKNVHIMFQSIHIIQIFFIYIGQLNFMVIVYMEIIKINLMNFICYNIILNFLNLKHFFLII